MKTTLRTLAAALAICVTSMGVALSEPVVRTPNVEARLIAETAGVVPGGTVTVALRQKIRANWHTYWLNPGDSGEPTTIEWVLPAGWSAGDIQWPYPHRLPAGPLMNFGYADVVLLLTDVQAPADALPGTTVELKADATWLVCEDICIPEQGTLELSVPVVAAAPPPNGLFATEFAATRAMLPRPSPWPAVFAADDGAATVALLSPELGRAAPKEVVFFPNVPGHLEPAAPQELRLGESGIALATKPARRLATPEKRAAVAALDGVVVITDATGVTQAFEVTATLGAIPPDLAAAGGASIGFLQAVLFAFLGGLILNLMPCVFPVLSMKALALMKKGGRDVAHARLAGLAYGAGVVVCFVAIAGVLIALRAGGDEIGWGFQLQTPIVVAALALLFFAIGLNLSGVFEIAGSFQNAGQTLAARDGVPGAFFTGVLAALVATPCTAPFMGAAVGFAATQPPALSLAVFAALGLGMAAPYVLLVFTPALVRRLPKPGAWMERLKQALAFPMYGSVVWLVWVVSVQSGSQGVVVALAALLVLAFGAWLLGWGQANGRATLKIVGLAALLASAATLGLLPPGNATVAESGNAGSGPAWEAWSPERRDAALAAGKPVFVNFTAAWCITCLVNEQVALSSAELATAFTDAGVVYLKGDWTNRDAAIARELKAHGRDGVPLYLFYPAGSSEPEVLPQILTPGEILARVKP